MVYTGNAPSSPIRQVMNLIFAVSQILTGYLLTLLDIGNSIQSQSSGSQTPVIPAGYAFSIWGFIFFFCLLYAIYQALPSQRENKLLKKLGWFTAGAFFLNTLWMIVAQLISFNWPTALIIVLILACALTSLYRLTRHGKTLNKTEKWLVEVPIAVLAGWVSVATFANFSSVLYQVNFGNFGLSLTSFSIGIIVMASSFTGFVLYKMKGNLLYGLTILWALTAILIANLTERPNDAVAYTSTFMILAVVAEIIILGKK